MQSDKHISKSFDQDLDEAIRLFLYMGGTAPNQVKQAVINGRARLKAFAWSYRFKHKWTDRATSDTRYWCGCFLFIVNPL